MTKPGGPETGRMFSERTVGGELPTRQVLRFGARVSLGDVRTLPGRSRSGAGGPSGVLAEARLRARAGEIWCRLRPARPFARGVRTLALNTTQPPTPTPDALELRRGMRVWCASGAVGKLMGVVVDRGTGLAVGLVVRVRGDVEAEATWPTAPLWPLLPVAGQTMLLPPAWATNVEKTEGAFPPLGGEARLILDASASQVAHSLVLRPDADLLAGIWAVLDANPAISPLMGGVRVNVRDGMVTLLGTVPTTRHRLSAEQDVWHVPGVLGVRNELSAAG
jgi:hypothetical protein